jgi:hypothetical protein
LNAFLGYLIALAKVRALPHRVAQYAKMLL